jgi:4-hydroxy-4-methyl-2-oxoglutarate aldolase
MKTVVVRNIKRTDAALVKRLGELGTSTAHEAYGRFGLMKPYLRPVWAGAEAAGTAVTVARCGPAPKRQAPRSPCWCIPATTG